MGGSGRPCLFLDSLRHSFRVTVSRLRPGTAPFARGNLQLTFLKRLTLRYGVAALPADRHVPPRSLTASSQDKVAAFLPSPHLSDLTRIDAGHGWEIADTDAFTSALSYPSNRSPEPSPRLIALKLRRGTCTHISPPSCSLDPSMAGRWPLLPPIG